MSSLKRPSACAANDESGGDVGLPPPVLSGSPERVSHLATKRLKTDGEVVKEVGLGGEGACASTSTAAAGPATITPGEDIAQCGVIAKVNRVN